MVNKEALAEQPAQQEPVAWTPINQPYPPGGELDILMGDGSILCEVLPQADGDLWWSGASTGERFIDPKYASVTHWRIHAEHTSPPAQQEPFEDLATELFVVAQISPADDGFSDTIERIESWLREHFSTPPQRTWVGSGDLEDSNAYLTPAQRKPLTDEQREEIAKGWRGRIWTVGDIIDATEAAHGIKENT